MLTEQTQMVGNHKIIFDFQMLKRQFYCWKSNILKFFEIFSSMNNVISVWWNKRWSQHLLSSQSWRIHGSSVHLPSPWNPVTSNWWVMWWIISARDPSIKIFRNPKVVNTISVVYLDFEYKKCFNRSRDMLFSMFEISRPDRFR